MLRKFAALTASLGLLIASASSAAAEYEILYLSKAGNETRITAYYGTAKPPGGFLKFCERSPDSCAPYVTNTDAVKLSREQWRIIDQTNRDVNHRIASVSDQEFYGQREFWTYPSNAGDCEDYVLLKRRELIGHGIPDSALLITVVLDEHREGHAVLTVSTIAGDYILDNRRDEIHHWSTVNYTFLKRQSANSPAHWIALAPQKNQAALVASGDNAP